MMHYKIVTNGHKFRIMYRCRYWPFWHYIQSYRSIAEYSTKSDAQKEVDRLIEHDLYEALEWK